MWDIKATCNLATNILWQKCTSLDVSAAEGVSIKIAKCHSWQLHVDSYENRFTNEKAQEESTNINARCYAIMYIKDKRLWSVLFYVMVYRFIFCSWFARCT